MLVFVLQMDSSCSNTIPSTFVYHFKDQASCLEWSWANPLIIKTNNQRPEKFFSFKNTVSNTKANSTELDQRCTPSIHFKNSGGMGIVLNNHQLCINNLPWTCFEHSEQHPSLSHPSIDTGPEKCPLRLSIWTDTTPSPQQFDVTQKFCFILSWKQY